METSADDQSYFVSQQVILGVEMISPATIARKFYRVVLLVFAFALSIPTLATDPSTQTGWSKLMLLGKRQNGILPDHSNLLRAVTVAEKYGENDPRLHIALYNAALAYSYNHRALSESLFKRDIANLEHLSVDFPDIVSDCFELANIYIWEGELTKAEPLLLRAASIRKKWKDMQSNDPFNAEIYSSFYMVYYLQGKSDKAAEAQAEMHKNLDVWRTHKTRAECLMKLTSNFHTCVNSSKSLSTAQQNHFLRMSLELAKEAAAYYKEMGDRYEYDYIGVLLEMTAIDMGLSHLTEAEQLSRQALKLAEDKFDSLSSLAFDAVDYLVLILTPMHRCDEAERLQDEYLNRVKQAHGAESVDYARELNHCAISWEGANRIDLAEKRRKEARTIVDRLNKH